MKSFTDFLLEHNNLQKESISYEMIVVDLGKVEKMLNAKISELIGTKVKFIGTIKPGVKPYI